MLPIHQPNIKKAFIITGGIASGKSEAAKYLKKKLPKSIFFNADECVASLWENPIIQKTIKSIFKLDNKDGDISYIKALVLKKIIENPCKKKALEAILHPEVEQAWRISYQAWMKDINNTYFISEIPLLTSQNKLSYQGEVILVTSPLSLQVQRLKQRLSSKGIESVDKQQPIIDFYLQAQQSWKYNQIQADYVIWNIQGKDFLKIQIDTIINHA